MRQISNKQLIGAIIAALVVLGGGGTAGGVLLESRGSSAAEKGLAELRLKHEADLAALRSVLDVLLIKTANSEGKLDSLITMVRDHMRSDR